MDEAINFLNVEIGVFLRYLRCFSQIENVQINQKTVELMRDAVQNMNKLSHYAQIVENSAKNDVDFLFDLDEHQYELQRHILCRTCYELFPLSKDDFMAHLRVKHQRPNSSGLNSFSSELFPENESTISQSNDHSTTTSPDLSGHHLSCDAVCADDSGISHNIEPVVPKYSDIVRKVAPPTENPRQALPQPKKIEYLQLKPIQMTLGDLIRTDHCHDAISLEMVEFVTPNVQRLKMQATILDILTQCVRGFDPTLKVHPFGSNLYGFSGPKTNYNILIDTRKSEKSPALLMRLFFQYLFTSNIQREFEAPVIIDSNRVQKQQIRMIHKASRVECYLLFDNDVAVIKAAKMICDVVTMKPICRQLIGYIRAWQNVVHEYATRNGNTAFQFNTYTISVLVIFFLQMNYGLPPVNDVTILVGSGQTTAAPNSKSTLDDVRDFDKMVSEFFHFYGARYEINNHLISVCVGRWQEQRLSGQQKHFTVEQKRLRDGMSSNPGNWKKCSMLVQDLVTPGLNITAEVTREEAYAFQEMCQMFSTATKHSPVKRVLKCSKAVNLPIQKTTSQNSLNKLNVAKSVANCSKTIKAEKPVTPAPNPVKKVTTKRSVAKASVVLENAIRNGSIFSAITGEIEKFTMRSDERVRHEARILGILKQHFKIFDRALTLVPFGSRSYGFRSFDSNYNILVDTRKSKFGQISVLESFEKYLASTNIQLHFDGIAEIPASRTLKQQLRMIHKESGIRVLLLADEMAVTEIPKIFRDFMTIKPICRNLIECIVAWQNALNNILAPNGTIAFQFNTYLISVLVIFFMQVNYDIPVIQEIASVRSNQDAMKKATASLKKDLATLDKILADFFYFYGQRYQIWNHVISLNIGRWQERRTQDQQKFFLPNQKRLRDGIQSNPANWKNCTMFVEDPVRRGVNIAAEITTKDAYGFQEMCQMFAKKNICYKIVHKDEED